MALQDLQNRTEADALFANFTKDIGLKHEAYKSKLQQAAVGGLDPHLEDLEQTRQSYSDQSNNPMVRRLFNSESRNLVARTTISAASHAAQQNKVWQDSTAKAVMQNNRVGAATAPEDEEGFQKKLDAVPTQVAVQAGAGDWGPEQTAHEVFKERSQLWRDRIVGMAKGSNTTAAAAMLADNKDKMEYTDWKQAQSEVQHGITTVGSRVGADNINAGWDPRMKPQEIDRAAGVQEPLIRIIKSVQQNHPELRFTIAPQGGTRTVEEQAELVRKGASKTMHSAHLEGRGIDVVPVGDNGQMNFNDNQAYARLEMAIKEEAEKLGIPLSPEHDQIKSWDPGHYSIPKNMDYNKVPDKLEEPLSNRIDRAERFASTQFPNDPDMQTVFRDALRQRVIGDFNQQKAAKRDDDFRNETTVGNAILNGVGDKKPTTPEELRADPAVAQAFDNLGPAARKKALGWLTQNSKDDFTANEERFRQYTKLQGQAETDPAAFLQQDIISQELPRQWRQHLLTMQQQKFKSSTMNPAVAHALDVLKPMLIPAQITSQNKDDYSQFVGSLHAAMQDYMEREKKPPKDADILEIGGRLLQQQHSDEFWFKSSTDMMYKMPVPDKDKATITQIYKEEHGIEPSDEMVRRIYIRGQYQDLYGGSVSKPKTTGAP